jgi:hypothetical protein
MSEEVEVQVRECAREILRTAIFEVLYHEKRLLRASRTAARVKTFLAMHWKFGFTADEALEFYEMHGGEVESFRTPDDYLKIAVGSLLGDFQIHREQLEMANARLPVIKLMLERAGIELPVAEIEQEEREKLERLDSDE